MSLTWKNSTLFFFWPRQLKLPEVQPLMSWNFAPGWIIQMDLAFFNADSIRGFTSTFVAIFSATSYPFVFPSLRKRLPLDILKFLVTTLRNHYKKVVFIWVDEDVALARYSDYVNTCHNINIIVQNTGGCLSSLIGKIKTPNKTLDNITRALLLKASNKKELWWFSH